MPARRHLAGNDSIQVLLEGDAIYRLQVPAGECDDDRAAIRLPELERALARHEPHRRRERPWAAVELQPEVGADANDPGRQCRREPTGVLDLERRVRTDRERLAPGSQQDPD